MFASRIEKHRLVRGAMVAMMLLTATDGLLWAQEMVKYGDSVYMFNEPVATYSVAASSLIGSRNCANALFFEYGSGQSTPYGNMHNRVAQAYDAGEASWIYGVAVTLMNPIVGYINIAPEDYPYAQNSIDSAIAAGRCNAVTLHSYNEETKMMTLQRKVYLEYPITERRFVYDVNFCSMVEQSDTVRSIEVYFDRPVTMSDTFFVGFQLPVYYTDGYDSCSYIKMRDISGNIHNVGMRPYGNCTMDTFLNMRWVYFPDEGDDNLYEEHPAMDYGYGGVSWLPWGLVFPILYPREDGCTAPSRPWLVERGDTWATIEWDTIHDVAELVVGPYNGDPDTMGVAASFGAGSTGHTVQGLRPGEYYGAWLRRECHWVTPTFDTTVWSPWSLLCLFGTTSEGVGHVEEVDFSVSPNPAHGSFTLRTGVWPSELTLYDQQGRAVYGVTVRGPSVEVGIGDLPRGVYHVGLTAADGRSGVRRLVVE